MNFTDNTFLTDNGLSFDMFCLFSVMKMASHF